MSWLVFVFVLEAGLLPHYGFVMYEPDPAAVIQDLSFYTQLEASVEAYGFYIGGGMRCYFWKTRDDYDFSPFQMTFRFDAGWRNEWLNVGFRHYCLHPVMPWMPFVGAPQQNWEGAYEELFIRIDGRLPLIGKREQR
jgi:hypothetical protein